MWVELHQDQELRPAVSRRPLVGRQEAGDVVVLLQQRQTVDGALVGVVLPVGRAEEFDRHAAFVKTASEHCAITTPTNQLPGKRRQKQETRGVHQGSTVGPFTFQNQGKFICKAQFRHKISLKYPQ